MSKHTEYSSYREKLIEHLFVGELFKLSWNRGDCQLEIAKPEEGYSETGAPIVFEDKVIIGITSDELAAKKGKIPINKYDQRFENLTSLISKEFPDSMCYIQWGLILLVYPQKMRP